MVNTILFMGIHRSGNHGLINWLIGNLRGKIIHINALHHRDLTPELYSRYSEKKSTSSEIYESCELEYYERDWTNFNHADWLILSLESVKVRSMKEQIVDFTKKTKCKSILLLRDPLNNAASMYKIRRARDFTVEKAGNSVGAVLECWDQHAKEMVEPNSFWTTRILFNRWMYDRTYRDQIMSDLGLTNSDSGFGKISGHGRSSFDQNRADARDLDLEGRYLSMISEEGFLGALEKKGVDLELWKNVCELYSHKLNEDYLELLSKFPRVE